MSWYIQLRMRVDRRTIVAEFEVQVWAGRGTTCHADISDHISPAYTLSAAHRRCAHHVGVKRLPAIAMVNDNQVAIPPGIPTGINHNARIGSIDRIA